MTPDYRSEPMESPEGKGIAKRAWQAYADAVNRGPLGKGMAKLLAPYGAAKAVDLMGFWLVWHLEGGFEGLQRLGMSRATIYRKIKWFRSATGSHPDEFVLPGVTIDVAKYLGGQE